MKDKNPSERLERQAAAPTHRVEIPEADRSTAGSITEEGTLQHQLEFHQLITRLLSKFVEIGKDTDATIGESLRAIGEFTGMDRAYVFQARADGRHIDNTHEWCAGGITPQIKDLQAIDVEKELPWFWERLSANQIFNVPEVSELPAEAAFEKAHFEIQGIQSLLAVPMRIQGKIAGFLGFDSVRRARAWSDDIVYLLRVAGQIIGNVLVAKNAEDALRESEQLKERLRHAEKMEAIGTLAGGIAHEFNNILSIILGNTEMAMDDIPDWSPGKYNLQEVRTASLRAGDIVKQLLSFSQKTSEQPKPLDIAPIVKDTLGFLRSYLPSPVEIRFGLSIESAFILGESAQINQVLINLCTNAADAMEENGGVLAIRLDQVDVDDPSAAENPGMQAGPHVQLTISDTGHGVPPDFIEKIFDPYFTTKPLGKGTGMGLAVVHGIVTACGGSILVESERGMGTIVKVLLPLIQAVPPLAEPTSDDLPGGAETVLFVDDDESIVEVGRQMLERLGYRVETRTCPVEALDFIRSEPQRFDLIITDMAMPRMSGDRLVKEILKIKPDMPIMLCSGFSEKIDAPRASAIGARMYIQKPIAKASLARKIRQVLGG